MKTTFKKVALASALLAGTALVAPQVAQAAAVALTADATGSGTNVATVFNAPFTTSFLAPYGARVSISVDKTGTGADDATADGLELVAFLYDANNNYVGYVREGTSVGRGGQISTGTVTLPAAGSGATKATFAFLFRGTEGADGANSDDTLNFNGGGAIAANRSVLLVTPGATENASTFAYVDVNTKITGNAYTTNAGATAGQLNEIGALNEVKAAAVNLTSSYTGPTLVSAGKDALTPAYIKLTFDAVLGTVADGSSVATQVKPKAGSTTEATVTESNSKTDPAGTKNVYIEKGAATAFTTAIDSVDIAFLTGAGTANAIQDRAGNHAKPVSGVTVTQFAKPAYASSGKVMLADTFTANTSGLVLADMFTAAGSTAGDATASIDVSIRMSEAIGSNFNAAGDLSLSTGLTFGSVQTATGNTLKVRLTLGAAKWRYNLTTGELERSADGGTTWTAATVALASEAGSKLTTAENQTLDSTLASTTVVAAQALAVGNVSTLDANANGVIDGATIDYKHALATPLAATNGVTVKDDDSATTAAATVSVATDAPAVLRIVASEASLQGFLETNETTAANLNTGAIGATLPFTVGVASSEITYAAIYDTTTGALKKVPDVAAASPATDGAKPVVISATYLPEEGTSPAAGQLKIVASETLNAVAGLDVAQIKFNGSSLQLLNLNDGVTALADADASLSTTSVNNDTVTLGRTGTGNGKVTANVLNKAVTLSTTTTSGIRDTNAAANYLATDGTKTVASGTTVFAGPTIAQAIGTRSANAVDGNIDTVIVKFSKGVQLASGGAKEDGMFKVRGTVGGTNYDVSIPAANIDITQAASGYVTLTIPSPGIKGTLTDLRVEYNAGTQATANKLVSTDSTPANITEAGAEFVSANDADTRIAQFSQNSTKLYTMEVKGTLTTDGSAVTPRGTIVRADLVDFDQSLSIKSINVTVPCQCTNGANLLIGNGSYAALATLLEDNARVGKVTKAYITTTIESSGAVKGVSLSTTQPGAPADRTYEVTVSQPANGQITISGNGVTGAGVVEQAPALKVLDTVYQVTNDGKFRFAIGNDIAPKNAFVSIAVKRPDDRFFSAITSPVQSFDNHLPFASNVTASGVIGGNLGTVNLSQIKSTSVDSSAGWQLVGLQGEIARTSDSVRKNTPVTLERLLISVRGTNGEPVSAWSHDNSVADEGFLLVNNVTNSALQLGATTVDNVRQVNGGLSIALKNSDGNFAVQGGNTVIGDAGGDLNAIGAADPFKVYYRSAADSTALNAQAAKWSLLTLEAGVADIATWANTNKVGAIIVVGSNNQQKAWFKGATDNTLSSLAQGDRAFVFFEGANTAFKFGRN